jgi:putative endonuclease
MHGIEKRIVYIIRSDADPSRHYVGITNNVRDRLEWHNHGPTGHTVSNRPWSLVVSMEFPSEQEAVRFEKYLKSGSGRALARRHFGLLKKGCEFEIRGLFLAAICSLLRC